MKTNKLTHGHNLMWESSRMMLPEHKELLRQHQKEIIRKEKPRFDEQEVECLEQQIHEAMNEQIPVKLTLFDPYDNQNLTGIIQKMDSQTKRIKIKQHSGEIEWINFRDLVQVEKI
ncbi:YolD-like family protein [Tenuibacillus multivorans]|uniref:YolD-like protein n=1 Tax=Tenuibacillus multivorans TaxID=237069 RepID=A0A1H0D1A3_9BACI|nr:YolD-like family protein [Tenuibacillus multivorans]GEL76087.1 hypothetical protein TMU01_03220 [Tenuibacillus multivorans]SDN63816.1 YolD-like protein [Tenuibacillus multivorans]